MEFYQILPYLEMNAIAAVTCLVMLRRKLRGRSPDSVQRLFNQVVISVLGLLALETASIFLQVFPARSLHQVVMALYLLFGMIAPLLVARYCMALNQRKTTRLLWLNLLPILIASAGIAVNLIHPFAYRIRPDGVYERLGLNYLLTLWPLAYILWAIFECICHYRRASDRETSRRLLAFCAVACICVLLSSAVYGIALAPLYVFNLVYLYLNVQRHREQALGAMAFRDALTGLRNTAAYRRQLTELDACMSDGGAQLGVVVMDVNGLKTVNDTLGHEAGNALLRTAAQYICDIFSHSPVFRIGGDEFVAILLGRDYCDRDALIARFDREMSGLTFPHDGCDVPVRIARGLAVRDPENDSFFADVFQKADRRMYENKQQTKAASEQKA